MPSSRRHIAILQTAFLGDTLLSIPMAKTFKEQGATVTLLCRKGLADLFLATGIFDHVVEIEKGKSSSYRDASRRLVSLWSEAETRILVSPHESHRSKFFVIRLRAKDRSIQTIGYRSRDFDFGLSRLAYTYRVDRPMNLPEALRQMALLTAPCFETASQMSERLEAYSRTQGLPGGRESSGALLPVPEWASMRVNLVEGDLASAIRRPYVVLAPSSVWRTKQWTEDGFVEVGKRLGATGRHVVVTGTKDEAELCERVARGIGGDARSFAGLSSLLETAQVMAAADIAVVNDSGSMHMAALVGTPTVAIFGPTVLDFGYRPWSKTSQVVEPTEKLTCRPCGLHGAQVCPIGTHICMKNTIPNQVWQKIESLLT